MIGFKVVLGFYDDDDLDVISIEKEITDVEGDSFKVCSSMTIIDISTIGIKLQCYVKYHVP